jgi:hypothetical protein
MLAALAPDFKPRLSATTPDQSFQRKHHRPRRVGRMPDMGFLPSMRAILKELPSPETVVRTHGQLDHHFVRLHGRYQAAV